MFGDVLRDHRRRLGMTQEELAERTGISVRGIRNLEAGRIQAPRARTLRILADALGLDGAQRDRFVAADVPVALVPAQLPPDVRGFAGRTTELERLDAIAGGAVVVGGTAGIGKTALAVHWAHRAAGRFPDGQLYVNLRGFDPGAGAMRPAEAVRGLLDALQVPEGRVPAGLDAQTGLLRTLLAGKRMLVLLDNARDAEQVRPLLPGARGCMVIVTSRNQLAGLVADGADWVMLDPLTEPEALQLLEGRLGRTLMRAQRGAVSDVVSWCHGLPLALTIIAARTAVNRGLTLADLAAQLRSGRLDGFSLGDPAVDLRPVFSWSYDSLSADAAQMFRLLGLHPSTEFGLPVAASLAGLALPQATSVLNELAGVHMVMQRGPGRYAMHDLLRAYATEMADAAGHSAALDRMLDYYLHSAHAAALLFRPGRPAVALDPEPHGVAAEVFATRRHARAWFAREHSQLVAAVELAADRGYPGHAWRLAWTLEDMLDFGGDRSALLRAQHCALGAAEESGDRIGQATAHSGLGRTYAMQGEFGHADKHLRLALDRYQELGDRGRQATTWRHIGLLSCHQDRHEEALAYAERGLEFLSDSPPLEHAYMFNALSWFHAVIGNGDRALAYGQQALAIPETAGDPGFRGNVLDGIGYLNHRLGKYAEAVSVYADALECYRDAELDLAQARTLDRLGDAYRDMGRADLAINAWARAVDVVERLEPETAAALRERIQELRGA